MYKLEREVVNEMMGKDTNQVSKQAFCIKKSFMKVTNGMHVNLINQNAFAKPFAFLYLTMKKGDQLIRFLFVLN